MQPFERFRKPRAVLLTTSKRDGSKVATPVNIAVGSDPDHAYFRTWSTAGKAKRLHHDPQVTIAPCTNRGKPIGPSLDATARLLDGAEAETAKSLLVHKYRLLQGVFVPLMHRIRHFTTQHYELTARAEA